MGLNITILPVVTKNLPISPRFTPREFLSRCKFNTLTTRHSMVEFYLLTFSRFPLRKKEHKSYFGKNRTHGFRTSRCADYLLDHSILVKNAEHEQRTTTDQNPTPPTHHQHQTDQTRPLIWHRDDFVSGHVQTALPYWKETTIATHPNGTNSRTI